MTRTTAVAFIFWTLLAAGIIVAVVLVAPTLANFLTHLTDGNT